MGKAAAQRRAKRMKYLSDLAKNYPSAFDKEWRKRINSWLMLIGKQAGKLRDKEGKTVAPVFAIVNDAMEVLHFCGKDVFKRYGAQTYDALTNECTKQLAAHIDSKLSVTNNFGKFENMLLYRRCDNAE